MTINQVQFQRGLSMAAFMERYGTEEKCRAALEVSRRPNGFTGPRCQCWRHCVFHRQSRKHFQCYRCDRQTSRLAGTILQSTRVADTIFQSTRLALNLAEAQYRFNHRYNLNNIFDLAVTGSSVKPTPS